MKGRTGGHLAFACVVLLAWGPKALALPKDAQIVRIPAQELGNNWLRDGLRPVENPEGKCGYMDAAGKLVVPYIYDGAEEFFDGRGRVFKAGKLGAVDAVGNLVIPAIYDHLEDFGHGLGAAALNGKYGIINKSGSIVVPFDYDELYLSETTAGAAPGSLSLDSLVKVAKTVSARGKAARHYGFINLRGDIVVPLAFDELDFFSEGLAWFRRSGKVGFIDAGGIVQIEAVYDEARGFREGLAAVKKEGKWGFIDPSGKTVIAFNYDAVPRDEPDRRAGFVDGIAVVGKGWISSAEPAWGYIDRRGRELTDFLYYRAHPLSEGMMAAQVYDADSARGLFLNKAGEIAIPSTFEYAGSFHNGRARVVTTIKSHEDDQNGIGYVDAAGKLVIPMKYTDSSDFDGTATVPEYARVSTSYVSITGQMYNPRYFTIDRDGKVVKPYGFESISDFRQGIAIAYDSTGQKVVAFIVDKSWKSPEPVTGSQDLRFPASRTRLLVDGRAVELDSYRIAGSAYCKLRDLAKALDGSAARFEVAWDGAKQSYSLTTSKGYTAQGGELAAGDGTAKAASPSVARVYLDGFLLERVIPLSIAGEDFIAMGELMAALGVKLSREGDSSTVRLDATAPARSVFRIITRVNGQNAIGISGSSKESGVKAITWDNDPTVRAQEFAFIPEGNKYSIVSVFSGKALTAENRKGAPVTLQDYAGSPGQLFALEEASRGFVSIVTSFGYYLGVSGGSGKRGTPLITWDRTGKTSQHFLLSRVE